MDVDAVVVGSGPNGLAAAVTMAAAGLRVQVIEGAPTIGGGCRTEELTLPGFWHDVCSAAHPLAVASPFFKRFDLAIGGGVKLSTGVFVLYADAESFTLMTPQGHMFAGWITFSAERSGDTTTVQAQVLMRANDPLYEVSMVVAGHRKEDKFWTATLTALGQRLGVADPAVEVRSTCVDSKRQWRHTSNIWHNSMVRSVLQTLTFRRGVKAQPNG